MKVWFHCPSKTIKLRDRVMNRERELLATSLEVIEFCPQSKVLLCTILGKGIYSERTEKEG